ATHCWSAASSLGDADACKSEQVTEVRGCRSGDDRSCADALRATAKATKNANVRRARSIRVIARQSSNSVATAGPVSNSLIVRRLMNSHEGADDRRLFRPGTPVGPIIAER